MKLISRHCCFALSVIGVLSGSVVAAPMKLTVVKHDQDRRYVVGEKQVPASRLSPPFKMNDEAGKSISCQWEQAGDGNLVRFLIYDIPAGQSPSLTLDHRESLSAERGGIMIKDLGNGSYSISNADHEITRYNVGPLAEKFKKPYFYPVMAQGVSVTRAWPMEDKPNESHDHPHHTGLYFAHGAVNGKDYWSKIPIVPKSLKHAEGPALGHLMIENAWGEDMLESQDILILDAGTDVVMDWSMTWKTPGKDPVALGKTKEGSFALRVATPLTSPDPGKKNQAGRGNGKMIDSFGNQDEEPIRPEKRPKGKQPAAWADNYGTIDGKALGICFMNHPTSYRFPTDWHVRNYGLFAANAFMLQEDTLKPDQPITFRYRVYIHAGDPTVGKVAAVYAGYANNKVEGD
jgi:hypothetical protein